MVCLAKGPIVPTAIAYNRSKPVRKSTLIGACVLAFSGAALPVSAQDPDPNQCLDCHEPAEDWAGMTVEQIIAGAKNPENKRHADSDALSDEQLKLMIGRLLPPQ